MKKLAEARQRQALAVEQLLTTISKSGTDCYDVLQATNITRQKEAQNLKQNVSSVGQKVSPVEHHSSSPINQGWQRNYASVGKVSPVPMNPMVKQTSAASSGEYLLQTSQQHDDYNDDDIYEDVLTQPEVRPVQPIRSVRGSDDDIIPVAMSSQLIIQEGSATGVFEEEEDLYDDLVGVMQQPPTVATYQHDAVTLGQNPPDEIYDDAVTLRQNPPDDLYEVMENTKANPPKEMYDDAVTLKQNPPDDLYEVVAITKANLPEEIYDDAITLRQNPPDDLYEVMANTKANPPEEIYDDAVTLKQNPPDEVYEVVANTKANPQEEIYDDAVTLRQNLPAPPGRNIFSPSCKEKSQSRTPPPIPSMSTITESRSKEQTPPPPLPARSPHTRLSSSRLQPPLPEETAVSYVTRDEAPTIPVRSPHTRLSSSRPPPPLPEETAVSYVTRDEAPTIPVRSPHTRLSSSRPPPPLPEETAVSYVTRDEPPSIPLRSPDTKLTTAQGMRRKTPPHTDSPPLPPRKESLSHADKPYRMPKVASRDPTEPALPPNISRANKPSVTNLPSKSFQNRLSNLFEGGSPTPSPSTKTKQQQRERMPAPPTSTKQQQLPSESPGVLPAKVQPESSNRPVPKHHSYEEVLPVQQGSRGVPPPHFPPVGHPFNPMREQNISQQLPNTAQSVKESHPTAQNIPPPPPLPGAPVPPPPPPIGNPKLTPHGSAIPTAPPPPGIGVPQASVPPPPPTPPTAHPLSQGVPPPPPPPSIGQPRPKVSPAPTSSQPTPGSAKPSNVPSGPPSMGQLLAGLADVKLKKASDRALPGRHCDVRQTPSGSAVPPAPPPSSVGVPQALVPGTPSMPPSAPPPPPIAPPPPGIGVPVPPPPPMPPVAPPPPGIGVPQASVPPPPPTPPTAHPLSQGVPPPPPPPSIGQPRPKVSPAPTSSQPTPGSAKPSNVSSGPRGQGDLLAGLADVKLKKASDRALPGMQLFC